jgi:hypothetical protein
MGRWMLTAVVAGLLLSVGWVQSSPVKGQRRQQYDLRKDRGRLEPGSKYVFREAFAGNERACVIIEGDHKPVMNLKVVVTDLRGNVVAEDNGPGDFLAAIWYPPRTEEYVVTIASDGKVYNDLDIVIK